MISFFKKRKNREKTKSRHSAPKGNKGFSLIDVVVGAVILVLAVLPICSGFVAVARTDARYRERVNVERLLMNKYDEIMATGMIGGFSITDAAEVSEKIEYPISEGVSSEGTIFVDTYLVKKWERIAYIEFTLTYNMGTEGDDSDDISLKGVYAP